MKIYLDSEYKCHVSNDGNMVAVENNFFHNKCTEFIEGYRFIPKGESWIRSDGVIFQGEMIAPWKNYNELESAQHNYEKQLLTEKDTIIAELDALVLNLQYNSLMEDL